MSLFIPFVATASFTVAIALVTADVFTPAFRAVSAPLGPDSSLFREAMLAYVIRYTLR